MSGEDRDAFLKGVSKRDEAQVYPEHEHLRRVHAQSQACGEFIAFLDEDKKIGLCVQHHHSDECYQVDDDHRGNRWATCGMAEDAWYRTSISITDLLAEHFGVDLKKLEEEKRAMLEELRRAQA